MFGSHWQSSAGKVSRVCSDFNQNNSKTKPALPLSPDYNHTGHIFFIIRFCTKFCGNWVVFLPCRTCYFLGFPVVSEVKRFICCLWLLSNSNILSPVSCVRSFRSGGTGDGGAGEWVRWAFGSLRRVNPSWDPAGRRESERGSEETGPASPSPERIQQHTLIHLLKGTNAHLFGPQCPLVLFTNKHV